MSNSLSKTFGIFITIPMNAVQSPQFTIFLQMECVEILPKNAEPSDGP